MLIREQIKKDLLQAVEQSGLLRGDFLENIEWLLKTVNKDNFENFGDRALLVGRLSDQIVKELGLNHRLVYIKPRIYAKIRGWWDDFIGYPELGDIFYYLLPLAIGFPAAILADKQHKNTFLLVSKYAKAWLVVVELVEGEGRLEIKTMFLMDPRRIKKEYRTIWQAPSKRDTLLGGLADPSVLAPRWSPEGLDNGVAGARFPSLQESLKPKFIRFLKESQEQILTPKDIPLEHPANPDHGDYSSSLALAKFEQFSIFNFQFSRPLELAEEIVKNFPKVDYLAKIEVVAPGFINFFLKKEWLQEQVGEILEEGGEYGIRAKFKMQNSKCKIQVEFISANPTGPLTAGNARGGFAGDVLANVLAKVGYRVQREYYLNDRGAQVEKLVESVKAYRRHLQGLSLEIPEGGYRGKYVRGIAQKIIERERAGQKFETPDDFKNFAIFEILKNIKQTIRRMGIRFDNFFSEQSLYDTSQAEKTLKLLEERGLTYKKDGAVWIKTTPFGDDKDRVLIKSDGSMTYIVSDIAYHLDKFKRRGFDQVILFWGADHHGYVPRFLAMMEALGHKGQARIELMQLLKLARGGREVRMSKRSDDYVTVDDVLDEIGLDAARFHFLAVPLSTPMTLDLKAAAERSQKNPVYYVQYANARICSILRKGEGTKGMKGLKYFEALGHPEELALIRKLIQFPEVVIDISQNHEVHRLPQYSIEVADVFHRFYENCRVLSEDVELTAARLSLVRATQRVLSETLRLMGIKAPERM